MKRFLVSISGRSNLGSKECKLRNYEICCAYVHGKSKAEAISKFWEQLEKNPLISRYYTRRDFKIEAERWESDELNCNGEPLGDLEWALPFDQLACAVWNNKTNKLESAEIINKNLKAEMLNEMADADQAKAEKIHDQILEKAQESNSEAQADDQESAPRLHNMKNKEAIQILRNNFLSIGCKRDGEIRNEKDEALLMAIKALEAQESSSDNSKEIIKETAEESTESNSKPHSQPVHHLKGAPRLINDSSADQSISHHTRIKLNFSLSALRAKRNELARIQWKEYTTRGNTERCQSLFKQIEAIDEEIERREKDGHI